MAARPQRILFLGLDGGTRQMLAAAFDRGWMPNLARFWSRSAWGGLRSTDPMVTPVAWTSFLTGCTPPTHGIHDFYRLDHDRRSIEPNHAGHIRVPTLWQHLAARSRQVISLNLPMTYPAPAVRGLVVAGTDAPGFDAAFAQCPEFGAEIAAAVPAFTHKIIWKSRPRTLDALRQVSRRSQQAFRALGDVARLADQRCDWSALMVHFHDLDSLQHRLWPYLDLDDTGCPDPAWQGEVVACLRAMDEAIGRLLELAERRGAAVIALSDHGFGPCRALVDMNGLLRQTGLQSGLAYGTRVSYRMHRLFDRLRRWRDRRQQGPRSQRSPRSVAGQVGCDWKHTAAFAPFGQLCGCVVVNRDVAPTEPAAARIRAEVIAACREATDPVTGLALFHDAFAVGEHYDLDPLAEGLPDVLALSADGFQAQAKWSPLDRRVIRSDWNLPATHYQSGVIALQGPGIIAGERIQGALPDVAPTAMAWLDLGVPQGMQGRLLNEAFRKPLEAGSDAPMIDPEHSAIVCAPAGARLDHRVS